MYQRNDGVWAEAVIVNGKKKYFYSKNKAELKRKIAKYNTALERGICMEKAIEEWLAEKEKEVSAKTVEGYRSPIKKINATFGGVRVKEITPSQVQAFVNSLAKKGYKRSTVQRPLDVMRMVFDYQMTKTDSTLTFNPCSGVRLPSGLTQECRDLASREDIERVKRAVNLPFGLFAYMLMYTGLRDGEILALTDDCFESEWITVNQSLTWAEGGKKTKDPKTLNGIRQVYILNPLAEVLPKWKGYLFSADGGKTPLSQTEFRHRWNNYCRAAGLADIEVIIHKGKNGHEYKRTVWHNRIVPYQLRHEFATMCFDAELDPKIIAKLMGHASEETSRRIYTHVLESRKVADIEKLKVFVDKK